VTCTEGPPGTLSKFYWGQPINCKNKSLKNRKIQSNLHFSNSMLSGFSSSMSMGSCAHPSLGTALVSSPSWNSVQPSDSSLLARSLATIGQGVFRCSSPRQEYHWYTNANWYWSDSRFALIVAFCSSVGSCCIRWSGGRVSCWRRCPMANPLGQCAIHVCSLYLT